MAGIRVLNDPYVNGANLNILKLYGRNSGLDTSTSQKNLT